MADRTSTTLRLNGSLSGWRPFLDVVFAKNPGISYSLLSAHTPGRPLGRAGRSSRLVATLAIGIWLFRTTTNLVGSGARASFWAGRSGECDRPDQLWLGRGLLFVPRRHASIGTSSTSPMSRSLLGVAMLLWSTRSSSPTGQAKGTSTGRFARHPARKAESAASKMPLKSRQEGAAVATGVVSRVPDIKSMKRIDFAPWSARRSVPGRLARGTRRLLISPAMALSRKASPVQVDEHPQCFRARQAARPPIDFSDRPPLVVPPTQQLCRRPDRTGEGSLGVNDPDVLIARRKALDRIAGARCRRPIPAPTRPGPERRGPISSTRRPACATHAAVAADITTDRGAAPADRPCTQAPQEASAQPKRSSNPSGPLAPSGALATVVPHRGPGS